MKGSAPVTVGKRKTEQVSITKWDRAKSNASKNNCWHLAGYSRHSERLSFSLYFIESGMCIFPCSIVSIPSRYSSGWCLLSAIFPSFATGTRMATLLQLPRTFVLQYSCVCVFWGQINASARRGKNQHLGFVTCMFGHGRCSACFTKICCSGWRHWEYESSLCLAAGCHNGKRHSYM